MDAGINNVIYMELNSGPKIANSTCGKTIVTGTIDRGSTVDTFVMFINFKHKRQVTSLCQLRFVNIITHLYAETVWQSRACDQC